VLVGLIGYGATGYDGNMAKITWTRPAEIRSESRIRIERKIMIKMPGCRT
jgi:hypothetical protein